tara:strand:- start:600 stop:1901 length:1302 start_codon:yes stop_codon:yes gene_type:complete
MKRILIGALCLTYAFAASAETIHQPLKDAIQTRMDINPQISSVAVSFDGLDSSCYQTWDSPDATESVNNICPTGGEGLTYLERISKGKYKAKFAIDMANTDYSFSVDGSDGQLIGNADLRLYVSGETKTVSYAIIQCTSAVGNEDCKGSFTITGEQSNTFAKEIEYNGYVDEIQQAIENKASSIAKSEVSGVVSQTLEDAKSHANQASANALVDANKHSDDANKALKTMLEGSIANNKSAAALAQQSANAASASVAALGKTVADNKTATDNALATKVDETYVINAIENIPAPEVDLSSIMHRLDQLEQENTQLNNQIISLEKEVPVAKVRIKGSNCPDKVCQILNAKNVEKVVKHKYNGYRIYFKEPLSTAEYYVSAFGTRSRSNPGFSTYGRTDKDKYSGTEPGRTKEYMTIYTVNTSNNYFAEELEVVIYE